jgi:MarR family 2-MHQ and catechol resistance regulon transcriptional repressor
MNIKPENSKQAPANGVRLWLILWKATRAMETVAHSSVVSLGLCPSDFGVLEALLHKGPLQVNEIGRKVLLTSGSITTAVDRLARRGLVVRQNDERDRRARVVHLTVQGRTLIRKLFARHERDMQQAVACLTAREVDSVTHALRKLGLEAERIAQSSTRRKSI